MTAVQLLTYAEAAKLSGRTQKWLKENVAAESIPHRRLGRMVRFTQADVEALSASRAGAAEATR